MNMCSHIDEARHTLAPHRNVEHQPVAAINVSVAAVAAAMNVSSNTQALAAMNVCSNTYETRVSCFKET